MKLYHRSNRRRTFLLFRIDHFGKVEFLSRVGGLLKNEFRSKCEPSLRGEIRDKSVKLGRMEHFRNVQDLNRVNKHRIFQVVRRTERRKRKRKMVHANPTANRRESFVSDALSIFHARPRQTWRLLEREKPNETKGNQTKNQNKTTIFVHQRQIKFN